MFRKKPLTYILASTGVVGVLGLVSLLSVGSLAFQQRMVAPESTLFDSLQTVTVAQVGELPISAREFLTSYETGPSFVKREHKGNARLAHLEWMIKEKIMALEGYSKKIDESADIQLLLSEIRADRAVEEMYKIDVLSQVEISEAELDQAAEEFAIKVWFRYIQLNEAEHARIVEAQLASGASFDSLSVPGHDPANQDPLSFWEIKQKDSELANQLAGLPTGEISGIIETNNGYFIARVDQLFKDPFMSEAGFAEQRRKLQAKMRQLEADSIAFEYAASRMEAANAVIKRDAFNELFNYFEALDKTGSRDLGGVMLGNWPGALDRTGMEEALPVPLFTTDEDVYTVSDFFDWYDLRRFPVQGSTPAARANQLKSIIWRMLRDRLLAKEAKERSFEGSPIVEEEVEWWREKMVYWEVREQLLEQVTPAEEDVAQVINDYPHRYQLADSLKNAQEAFKELYTLRERIVLEDYFAENSSKYDIVIDTLALLSLPVRTDGLAKPIDMAVFKKEGTFPRIAYPTIDRVWERY